MKFAVIKKIDTLGRVVIPIEMRKHYGIELNDKIELVPSKNGILIKNSKSGKSNTEKD